MLGTEFFLNRDGNRKHRNIYALGTVVHFIDVIDVQINILKNVKNVKKHEKQLKKTFVNVW